METALINPKENPSGTLDLNLEFPNGRFDYIDIDLELLSTTSNDYYLNKKIPERCITGYKQTVKYSLFNQIKDLCMLSNYNVTSRTVLNGFNSVEYSDQFETG